MSQAMRVLTLGAFERDNFGDTLFHEVTKNYLQDADVTAGSIMAGRLSSGEPVVNYRKHLATERVDAIWVVGGEVGGVVLEDALAMSLAGDARAEYLAQSPQVRRSRAEEQGFSDHRALAYLPEMGADGPQVVVNSVGLSALARAEPDVVTRSLAALQHATAVHVRDVPSHEFLTAQGVTVSIGPDMVHAITGVPGYGPDDIARPLPAPYALVQINVNLVRHHTVKEVAHQVATLAREADLDVVLFAAGVAPGHDSLGIYAAIAAAASRESGARAIRVLTDRNVTHLVHYVARAEMWVGTSLHGRVLAAAYAVPRISLENEKVSRYATTWDPAYAHGVDPANLAREALRGLTSFQRGASQATATRLASQADAHSRRVREALS
ncbi:polysaccharide pyruvyl transferase family protein [Demequina sp.]|uniref:polysaccharide pyruvyl transferase family protein n=1 Tax=Demequina sp. TaxID=2050685 RepID=UPI0025C65D52|nr:polysaccharide pyruvyl transferase family protein [Demequina sp.]